MPPAQDPIPKTPASEADYLRRQAEEAKAALSRTLDEIKANLAQGGDPREWTKQYPWLALGAAATAGFIGATLLVPSREEQAIKRLEQIEKALFLNRVGPAGAASAPGEDGADAAHKVATNQQSFVKGLLGEVIKAVRPAVLSALTAGITAKVAKTDPEEIHAAAAAGAQSAPPLNAASAAPHSEYQNLS